MDYNELADSIPNWMYAQNRDLAASLPDIVDQAHRQLFNTIDHEFFRTKITALTIPTSGTLDLSTQQPPIMEIRAIRLKYRKDDEWTPLFRRDLEGLSMLYARNAPGRPRYYAEDEGPLRLQVFPTPNMEYLIEVTCNQECPIMSPAAPNNLLGDHAPRALKFTTLRLAAMFMRDTDWEAKYAAEAQAAINELNASMGRRRRDDTAERPRDTTNATGS